MRGKIDPLLSTNQLRSLFLNYFHDHKHQIVASSSLVPTNDPTLLFTNAGMVQFKDMFLGKEHRSYHRATSAQRCVRAGGKHNDLERVGYTGRHHTFFEMLGNFSFGDYFKREAIQFAWRFLTNTLKLPEEKLWVTVYQKDEDTAAIWLKELNINPHRFSRLGEDSNFWSMGPTGPCGPCTEIFYDHGADIVGGPPGSPDEDGDRYVEIWNLVFMQFDRSEEGTLTPLPKPSVDTGMGLERITAVMQGVSNTYDIDLFQRIIQSIATLAHTNDLKHTSLRVIADHIRSCAFLITDHVTPSNEGRGYVLRRIIRRAIRHGHQLGMISPFFYRLVQPLVAEMGDAYPELKAAQHHVEIVLKQEEEQFNLTLSQGLKLFEQAVLELSGHVIPGSTVFKLYDTYGFPADLTADLARERHLQIDLKGFETEMSRQRARSRRTSQFEADYQTAAHLDTPTIFTGYNTIHEEKIQGQGKIVALYQDGKPVELLTAGATGSIILDRTPFYAESGGQIGDQGTLENNAVLFEVLDTQKQGQAYIHLGQLKTGECRIGDTVSANVNVKRRRATVLNHTATHLLHMILRQILGNHVIQKGSLVQPERLRFDFSHTAPVTIEQLKKIEQRVNEEIRFNHEAAVRVTSTEEATKEGAIGLFEDKYGETVRVVRFGDSIELCGGTHAHHTGDIGIFKITAESGVAAGIRRIEAVTGEGALLWIEKRDAEYQQKIQQSEEQICQLEKQISQLTETLVNSASQTLLGLTKKIGDTHIVAAQLEYMTSKSLRMAIDQLRHKLGKSVIALASVRDGKVTLVTSVSKDLITQVNAGNLVSMMALQVGGKGGGRPDLAEGGGNQPENLTNALESVYAWVEDRLK